MKVNFVILNEPEESLERLRELDPVRDWRALNSGVYAWILQTFLAIGREIGATLTSRLMPDSVNVVHNAQLLRHSPAPSGLVIGVRADYPSSRLAHWEIVQNKRQVCHKAIWVPHWPQQGLIPRRRTDDCVRRVGYFGRGVNHYSRLLRIASGFDRVRSAIERCCAKAGLELVSKGPDCWNDYSDVDIAIGIRAFGQRGFDGKPPTKLFNAWRATVPFVGGADSAFHQVGRDGESYLCAPSEDRLLNSLVRLRDDRGLCARLITTGEQLSEKYSFERIAEHWLSLLKRLDDADLRWT